MADRQEATLTMVGEELAGARLGHNNLSTEEPAVGTGIELPSIPPHTPEAIDVRKPVQETSVPQRRRLHVSRKKRSGSPSCSPYRPYVKITDTSSRRHLLQLARIFLTLDKFFAWLYEAFLHSERLSKERSLDISSELAEIRGRASTGSISTEEVFLGDLGHHCERVAKYYRSSLVRQTLSGMNRMRIVMGLDSDYKVSDSNNDANLQYLQDGLEIPYWELILSKVFHNLANSPPLFRDAVPLTIENLKLQSRFLRHKIQSSISAAPQCDDIQVLLVAVDKRIALLDRYAALSISNAGGDEIWETIEQMTAEVMERPKDESIVTDKDLAINPVEDCGPSLQILVPLVIFTLMGAFVPFIMGTKRSNEAGSTDDSDFWFNICGSIFTFMSNLVTIMQLADGSRFSRSNIATWIWFFVGVCCAVASAAIYPFYDTLWSSLLAFFSNIAAFGSMLAVTMAARKARVYERGAKRRKID